MSDLSGDACSCVNLLGQMEKHRHEPQKTHERAHNFTRRNRGHAAREEWNTLVGLRTASEDFLAASGPHYAGLRTVVFCSCWPERSYHLKGMGTPLTVRSHGGQCADYDGAGV